MGQRQRVRLAMAFLHVPSVMLLDEPRNSLDEDGYRVLNEQIQAAASRGAAVLWCSPRGEERVLDLRRQLRARGRTAGGGSMRSWLDAAIGVVRRDAVIFLTYRTQVMTQMLGMLFQLTIFYFISKLLQSNEFGSPEAYFAFVVVGLAIVQALIITLGLTPAQVRQELVAGTMERFIVSAFGATNGIVSMMVFPIISALVIGAIMLAWLR